MWKTDAGQATNIALLIFFDGILIVGVWGVESLI